MRSELTPPFRDARPNSHYASVTRTEGYTYAARVWAMSLVQGLILCRPVPNPDPLARVLVPPWRSPQPAPPRARQDFIDDEAATREIAATFFQLRSSSAPPAPPPPAAAPPPPAYRPPQVCVNPTQVCVDPTQVC
jgi:hypothetical protein